jgi:hypothetical protein
LTQDTYLGQVGEPPSLNRYLYGYGNPGRWSDPTGHAPEEQVQNQEPERKPTLRDWFKKKLQEWDEKLDPVLYLRRAAGMDEATVNWDIESRREASRKGAEMVWDAVGFVPVVGQAAYVADATDDLVKNGANTQNMLELTVAVAVPVLGVAGKALRGASKADDLVRAGTRTAEEAVDTTRQVAQRASPAGSSVKGALTAEARSGAREAVRTGIDGLSPGVRMGATASREIGLVSRVKKAASDFREGYAATRAAQRPAYTLGSGLGGAQDVMAAVGGGVKNTVGGGAGASVRAVMGASSPAARFIGRADGPATDLMVGGLSGRTTTSGAVLKADPLRTTTIIGSYRDDIKGLIDIAGDLDTTAIGQANPGGFNLLNVPNVIADRYKKTFWEKYNKPWLEAAIGRGDNIVFATEPTWDVLTRPGKNGLRGLSGYGREYKFLRSRGYRYDPITKTATK